MIEKARTRPRATAIAAAALLLTTVATAIGSGPAQARLGAGAWRAESQFGLSPASAVTPALGRSLPANPDRTQSVDNTPPGDSGDITDQSYATASASGDCADLGPHICDWETSYRDFRYR